LSSSRLEAANAEEPQMGLKNCEDTAGDRSTLLEEKKAWDVFKTQQATTSAEKWHQTEEILMLSPVVFRILAQGKGNADLLLSPQFCWWLQGVSADVW
jgi:hypothetical protein